MRSVSGRSEDFEGEIGARVSNGREGFLDVGEEVAAAVF